MGNITTGLKRFLTNKNTVTIIGVILGVIVLYIGYSIRVKNELKLIKIPVAKTDIASRTLITEDMITTITIPQSTANSIPNLVQNETLIVGKYLSYGTSIAANSMFYSSYLLTSDDMPDSAFADIPENSTIFSLSVSLNSTYGNSIFPSNYIDLYIRTTDSAGKLLFGKFIESIEVLDVKDSIGNHVFESSVESRTPSELLFAVPDEMFLLLKKAQYLGAEIIPVPRNAAYSANPDTTSVSSTYIKEIILSKTATIPDEVITTSTTE